MEDSKLAKESVIFLVTLSPYLSLSLAVSRTSTDIGGPSQLPRRDCELMP